MTFQVVLAHEAEKLLDRLDRPSELRIRHRIIALAADPFDPRLSAPLTERAGLRRSRVWGWRILFQVNRSEGIIYILAVDTRGQVYKHS